MDGMNIVVVFPGQGSQSIGMLSDYAEEWPQVQETFKQASDVLGYDCWDIVCNGPAEKINKTEITQPVMLAADIAVMRVMQQQCMLTPMVFAGHSLGEYAALVAAQQQRMGRPQAGLQELGPSQRRLTPKELHIWVMRSQGWCCSDCL